MVKRLERLGYLNTDPEASTRGQELGGYSAERG